MEGRNGERPPCLSLVFLRIAYDGCDVIYVAEMMDLAASSTTHSQDMLSYYDASLMSSPVKDYQSSHVAVLDMLSAGTDVKYLPVDSSPSVITLLSDKLQSQSKATII